MITDEPKTPPDEPAPEPAAHSPSLFGRLWSMFQLLVAVAVAGGTLGWLLLHPDRPPARDDESSRKPPEPAEVSGPMQVRLRPDSTLEKRYRVVTVKRQTVSAPVVNVTGTVVASMRHGENGQKKKNNFWQFNAPEMLTAYHDWKKAIDDVKFYTEQLKEKREAAEAAEDAQKGVVRTKRELVAAGTETKEVLAVEKAKLDLLMLGNKKELHEAGNSILTAKRSEAALARQIQQGGLDPDLLREADPDLDVVMAEVPEQRFNQIHLGQACEARFLGLPGQVFSGKVRKIAPVVSKDRRTLRVLFQVHDPEDTLRPGMFAEIGMGTEVRQVLQMPAEGVVHVGKDDYALVESGERSFRVARLELGETYGDQIEVVKGLKDGERVMSSGAILMKTFIIRAAQASASQGRAAP